MNTAKIKALLIDALQLFAKEGEKEMPEVDMSVFSRATLIANAVKALEPDVPYLNEIEKKTYSAAIDNWKLNKAQGFVAEIPDPPMAYELVVKYDEGEVYLKRGAIPVCEKFVDKEEPTVSTLKAGAILPPFAPGRYLCVMGDNAPAGYRLTLADGTVVEKVVTPWFAGVSQEYRKVQ